MSIHVGSRVLYLSMLCQDLGGDLAQLTDQSEKRIIREVLLGKLSLAHIARVCLTQYNMAKTRNNLCIVLGGGGGDVEREREKLLLLPKYAFLSINVTIMQLL